MGLGLSRRRRSTSGAVEIPDNVLAWVDLRRNGIEMVRNLPEHTEGGLAYTPSGAAFDGVDDGIGWFQGATAFSGLPAGDFCAELFGLSVANERGAIIGDDGDGNGERGFQIYYMISPSRLLIVTGTTAGTIQSTIATPPVNTPFHLCVERSGNNWTAYLDGAPAATWVQSGTPNAPVRPFRIARRHSTDFKTMGLVAVRLTDGVRYGGAFTPPATPNYGAAPPPPGYGTTFGRVLTPGARTWFNSPSMQRDGDSVLFPVARDGGVNARLIRWNMVTDAVTTAFVSQTGGSDDHNEGGILKLADGSWLYASVGHNVEYFYVARGATPETMTEANIFADLASQNLSYANVVQHEGEANDPIYLFGRGGSPWSANYSSSIDGGATWSPYVVWSEDGNNRPYVQYWKSSPTRTDFILTQGHPDTLTTSVYHGYLENGTFYKADGTALGPLPINPASFTLVHSGATNGACWVWDLKRIGSELVAYFSAWTGATHIYFRGVLTGSTWSVEPIEIDAGPGLYAGQPNYAGGLCGHPTDKDVAFLSCAVDGIHQLFRATRSGGVWTKEQLTYGALKHFRPDTVDGVLTWVRGYYLSYQNFSDCEIMGVAL